MRIIEGIEQRTEAWDRLRARPTASQFARFCTPAKGDYAKGASEYAAEIISKRLGTHTEPPPSFWMEWGTHHEVNAKHAYAKRTGHKVCDVGFVVPDGTDAYGGSPDGLIDYAGGWFGMLETKCPAPHTLISYHAAGVLPAKYRPQVQGLLLITGLPWCDFYAFHPELTPFLLRVEPDIAYQAKIAENLLRLLEEVERIADLVGREEHELVAGNGEDFEGAEVYNEG